MGVIYDQFISNIITIVQRLDLRYSLEPMVSKDDASADMDSVQILESNLNRLHANKLQDFQVFFNLVDFSREILQKFHLKFFDRWV
jgi:hypothetical protein